MCWIQGCKMWIWRNHIDIVPTIRYWLVPLTTELFKGPLFKMWCSSFYERDIYSLWTHNTLSNGTFRWPGMPWLVGTTPLPQWKCHTFFSCPPMWELYLSFDSDTPLLYSNCPASHGTYAMVKALHPSQSPKQTGIVFILSRLMSLCMIVWLGDKESACNAGAAGDASWVPGSGRSLGRGHDNPLQYSCLENTMGRGAWHAAVHSVVKSWTLSTQHAHSLRWGSANRSHRSNLALCLFLYHLWVKNGMVEEIKRSENYMKFKSQYPEVKFYWNTAQFIHFQIVYGCFCAAMSSYNSDCMAHKSLHLLSCPLQKTKSLCVITSEKWYGSFFS